MDTIGVAYVNVNCRDLDVSLAFYLSLGFRLAQPFPEKFYPRVGVGYGVGPHRLRGALLSLGENQLTQLDLVEWIEPGTGDAQIDLTRSGFQRIAIASSDFASDYERLKAAGVQFLSEPMTVSDDDLTPIFVCFRDPDGNILELVPRQLP